MDEVARRAAERFRSRAESGAGRIDSYLFEDRADPCLVVAVSRWESRTAFTAMLGRIGVIGGMDLYEGEPSFAFYRPLLRYVRMFEPSEIATLTIVEGDTAKAPELRDYVVSNRKRMDLRAMGIVEHEIGEDEDRPGRFAFFARWRTAAAVEASRPGPCLARSRRRQFRCHHPPLRRAGPRRDEPRTGRRAPRALSLRRALRAAPSRAFRPPAWRTGRTRSAASPLK